MQSFEVHDEFLIKKYFVFPAKPKHAGFQAHFDAFFLIFSIVLYIVLGGLIVIIYTYEGSKCTSICIVVSFVTLFDMHTSGTVP